jgi:hypothetical protein
MQINFKNYQISKTKNYLKKNNFLLFSINANQNSQNWLKIEQGLHKLNLSYYKTYNNSAKKIIKNSIYKNSIHLINSTFFFLKPIKKNDIAINLINSIFFTVLAIKLNKTLHLISQLKKINSLNYKKNVSITYQFLLTNFKMCNIVTTTKNS